MGVNEGVMEQKHLISHRIWTLGAPRSSNPMRNRMFLFHNTFIHTSRGFWHGAASCTLSEPDPDGFGEAEKANVNEMCALFIVDPI